MIKTTHAVESLRDIVEHFRALANVQFDMNLQTDLDPVIKNLHVSVGNAYAQCATFMSNVKIEPSEGRDIYGQKLP